MVTRRTDRAGLDRRRFIELTGKATFGGVLATLVCGPWQAARAKS